MSTKNRNTLGEIIRELREKNKIPLRKLAALLDIDPSTLSKIEHNTRNVNDQILEKISNIFEIDIRELKIHFLSDKISYELKDKEFGLEVLKVAEKKLKYRTKKK